MSQAHYRCLLAVAGVVLVIAIANSVVWSLLSGVLSIVLAIYWPLGPSQRESLWLVNEAGQGQYLGDAPPSRDCTWQICPRSKLLPFALYLVLFHPHSKHYESCWILPWQVSDTDYRRLARIVFRQGQH